MTPLSTVLERNDAYLIVVLCSIPIAAITSKIRNATIKKVSTATIGFSVVLAFCGVEVLHSFLSIIIGAAIIVLLRHSVMLRVVFTFSFLYRIFFCTLTHYGIWRDENNLANGIQLVLTIKLISVANEVAEFRKHYADTSQMNGHSNGVGTGIPNSNNHRTLQLCEEPSFLDIICYMYCFLGIGTGPFFRFRTYYDMIHMPANISKTISAISAIVWRLPILMMLVLVSVFGGKYFNVDEMTSQEFYTDRSMLYRFLYVIPIGAIGMARYGVVWYLSEFGYFMAGLGVYPEVAKSEPGRGPTVFTGAGSIWPIKEGPKPMKYDYETIRNVYIEKGFTAETYAKTFRWWNCTVQWWLAHFVYASKLFSGKPAFVKWLAVAVVSAVWHGFKAGYYFSFIGMVYIAFCEHLLLKHVGERLGERDRTVFDIIHYVLFKAVGIGSFMTTFVLSSYDDVMRYLCSVYYGIFAIGALSCIISITVRLAFSRKPNSVITSSKDD